MLERTKVRLNSPVWYFSASANLSETYLKTKRNLTELSEKTDTKGEEERVCTGPLKR